MGPMRCATCVPCSPVGRSSGKPTGIPLRTERMLSPWECYLHKISGGSALTPPAHWNRATAVSTSRDVVGDNPDSRIARMFRERSEGIGALLERLITGHTYDGCQSHEGTWLQK